MKPSNIIVRAEQATLIDLSLARRPGVGRPGSGTLGYLAPEQAEGGPLSEATDMWGIGITMGESVTDRMAFGDEQSWEGRRIRSPRPGRRFTRALERRARRLAPTILACLEHSPGNRPTLAELRSALTPLAPEASGGWPLAPLKPRTDSADPA